MAGLEKPPSPFFTGKPLPPTFFVGRKNQFEELMQRGASAVAHGKPMAYFLQGEFGIGKTSLAHLAQSLALNRYRLHPIRASLAGCKDLNDVASAILQGALDTSALDAQGAQAVTSWLGDRLLKLNFFGIAEVDTKALKEQAPTLSSPFGTLAFLKEYWRRLAKVGYRGLFLLLDELNGIASSPDFAHFLKGIVDSNSGEEPVPLLLMLAGTAERRGELIDAHQPVNRIFSVLDLAPLADDEVLEFYARAFNAANLHVTPEASQMLTTFARGTPIVVQELGDATYYFNQDEVIDSQDVAGGVLRTAEEIGAKFVGPGILDEIKSEAYRSILDKIGSLGANDSVFSRNELAAKLNADERKKLDNCLARLRQINAITQTGRPGEYAFQMPMVRIYLWLRWMKSQPEALSRNP